MDFRSGIEEGAGVDGGSDAGGDNVNQVWLNLARWQCE